MDVFIEAIGDAKNLRGGTLLMVPLRRAAPEGRGKTIYAVAQGKVIVNPGLRDGRISGGGEIKRELNR